MLSGIKNTVKPSGSEIGRIQNSFIPYNNITLNDLKVLIENGITFKPATLSGRKNKDFVSQQLFAMDFDSGITIEDAISKSIDAGLIPNAYYESFSSTQELVKFRLLFVLDEAITDYAFARKCRIALMEIFKGCDVSCKDATRMFFGTDKEFVILNTTGNNIDTFTGIINSIDIPVGIVKTMTTRLNSSITYTTEVKRARLSDAEINFAINNIQLLNKFFNDDTDRLHYEDVMIVASNFNCIDGGVELVKNRLDNSPVAYEQYHYDLLQSVISNDIRAMSFNRSSTLPQDVSSVQKFVNLNFRQVKQAEHNYLSDMITLNDIKTWNCINPVVIKAGTGCGKTYFCINVLAKYVESIGGKMLLLQNRRLAKNMFIKDIELMVESNELNPNVVVVRTYQSLEEEAIYGDLHTFTHVVFDECHYFTTDCSFNTRTIDSFNRLVGLTAVKVFMTATDEGFFETMEDELGATPIVYDFGVNYNHVKRFICFDGKGYVEAVLDKCKRNNTKAMVFMESRNALTDLYMNYRTDSLFLCAETKSEYRYVNKESLSNLIEDGSARKPADEATYVRKFDKQFIFATSVMDTGFNIKDDSFTDIICSAREIHKIVQWIGRYRAVRNSNGLVVPQITVHIHNVNGLTIVRHLESFFSIKELIRMIDENGSAYYDRKTLREKDKEWYIYHDNVANDYKVNLLGRVYANRQYSLLSMLKSKELKWIDILRQRFGKVDYSSSATQDEDRVEYLNGLIGTKLIGKKAKDIFLNTLNFRKRNEVKRTFELIRKTDEVNECLIPLGYFITTWKSDGQRALKIEKITT